MPTLGLLVVFAISALLLSSAGAFLLRALKFTTESAVDRWLFSIAAGAVLFELAVTAGECAPSIRTGVRIACAMFAAAGLANIRAALADLCATGAAVLRLRGARRYLGIALLLVLLLQGLASLAPLTGSDALHYHFTVQQLYLNEGFHAPWSLLHGFFCGLGHQLILAALAFGSTRLAQLWLFLGGALGALAALRLAQFWTAGIWPWLAALTFALTPVAFWQITSAGAPDIWMCALVPVCLLAIFYCSRQPQPGAVVLAGFFAGAIAGTKYTGLLLAAALLAGFWLAARSAAKLALFFSTAAATGIWMYLRNWVWTGDPVFPFYFARSHAPDGTAVNAVAIQSILADTGASHVFHFSDLLKFPLFAAVDYQHLGAWQLLGPLVLAFAPVALPQLRKTLQGRIALLVWISGALAIGATSAMARFLLPLLPVALAGSFAGVALSSQDRWRTLRLLSLLSTAGFLLAGFAALCAYSRQAWSAALGRTSPENYLSANAPDYRASQFVNREVQRLGQPGRTLVFFHHLYYLRVPFFSGDPADSWEMNPAQLSAPQPAGENPTGAAWRDLFRRHQIRWVLKSSAYPDEFAAPLANLEKQGVLNPCASAEAENFSGNRIEGVRIREQITLLCVQDSHP